MSSTGSRHALPSWAALLALAAVLVAFGASAGRGLAGGAPAGSTCYALATSVASGSGSVSAIPNSSGSCPAGSYRANYIVTVSASPAPGWAWSGWTGTDNDGANPTFVTMNADRQISASFSYNCFTLTKQVGGGSGSISASPTSGGGCPSGQYSPGYIVTLNGQPSPGWTLTAWSGTDNDMTNPTTVTMSSDRTVIATFSQNCVTLTTSVSSGSGTISVIPNSAGGCGNRQYSPGYIVTLAAVGSPGWIWSGWTGTDNNNMQSTTVTMNGDRSVTASFTGNCYTLTKVVSGSGSITTMPNSSGACPNGQYSQGYIVTLIAVPGSGYILYGWDGTDNDFLLTTTITMSGNRTVTAYFIEPAGPTPTPPPPPTPTPPAPPTPTTPAPPTPPPPTPPGTPTGARGDVDCSEVVSSIDAALLLQLVAGLVGSLPCQSNADVDETGTITSIDGALVLQYVAGLIAGLPPG